MVALDFALRHCGLPSLDLWYTLLPSCTGLRVCEDNQAMIRVIETGKNPTMRYLHRTHRVSVAWLHEVCQGAEIKLTYEVSAKMAADIFTKAFPDKNKWTAVCDLINHIDPARLKKVLDESRKQEEEEDTPA